MKNFYQFLIFLLLAGGLVVALKLFVFSDTPYGKKEKKEEPDGELQVHSPKIPNDATFAGENIPQHYFDVREGIDRELLVNTYWHSHTMQLIKRAARYFPIIEPILAEEGVPDDFKYVAVVESDLRHPTSPAGAKGMWQFLGRTAKEYGLEVNNQVDERYNVRKSTRAACNYFKKAKEDLGTWTLAAGSYNVGRYGIKKQMKRQHEEGFYDLLLNSETQRYIYRVIALKYIMQDPKKYNFNLKTEDLYLPIPTQTLEVDTSVTDFAVFAEQFDTNYKILKYFNPWLRQTYLHNNRGKTYHIVVPEKGMRDWRKIKEHYFANDKK